MDSLPTPLLIKFIYISSEFCSLMTRLIKRDKLSTVPKSGPLTIIFNAVFY